MLDYRLLVFRTVAEKLNFTRAAEVLHISQPAVTQHIKQLEAHYGTPLFRRSPAGIALTDAGHVLFDHASRTLDAHGKIEAQIRAGLAVLTGPLRLGASMTIAQYLLPRWLGKFQQAQPGVALTLRNGNTEEITGALLAGRIDLGLIEGPSGRRELKSVPFFEDEILCLAAPTHPLARKARVTLAELAGAAFVGREPGSGTRHVVERALKKAGLTPGKLNVVLESSGSETIKGLLASGLGLGFLSRLAAQNELALGQLSIVPVRGLRIARPFYFLHLQGPPPTGPAGAFIAFSHDAARAT